MAIVSKLARQRKVSKATELYAKPDTWRLVEKAMYNREARETLGLDGGPRGRPKGLGSVGDVGRFLRERPELCEVARELCRDVQALWPGATIDATKAFAEDLADAVLDELTGIDDDHLCTWLETVLLVGAAVDPPEGSGLVPMRLPTREHFLEVSGLTDQSLAALERELGVVGRQEAIMVTAVSVAQEHGLAGEPTGIVAGTTHLYCTKEALGLGRVAVRADVEDVAAGHGKEGDPIYHAVRSAGYFLVPTTQGEQRLIRAVTVPLVAPGDLRALHGDDPRRRGYTRRWLAGTGLTDLVARGEVSCTAQQAHAARRLHDDYVERTGRTLPILIPAIRIEQARSHRMFSSPIGPYNREMPGNTIEELRLLHRILGPRARIWLAEAGVEHSPHEAPVEPDWRIRLPGNRFARGSAPIVEPERAEWVEVFEFEDQLVLSELKQPVALSWTRSEDMVLLRAVGELDRKSKSRPSMWLVASRSLRSDPDLANDVGELLLRLHGSRHDSARLREERTASFNAPARVLGGRAKNPHPWLVRELERQLANLASLMTDEDHDA